MFPLNIFLVFAALTTWALATAISPPVDHLDLGGSGRCRQIDGVCDDIEHFHLVDNKTEDTSEIVKRGSDYAMKADEHYGLFYEVEGPRQHDVESNGKIRNKDVTRSSYELFERRAYGNGGNTDEDEDQHKATTHRGDYYDNDEQHQRHRPYDNYYPYPPRPYPPNGYPYYPPPTGYAYRYPGYPYYPPYAYSRPYIPNHSPAFPVGTGATAPTGTNTGTTAGSGVGTGSGGGAPGAPPCETGVELAGLCI